MKHLCMILALALLAAPAAAPVLAAQDTTQMAPAAEPMLTVTDAVVARSVLDREPQDTGTAFPADVGQFVFWTKVAGAPAGVETIATSTSPRQRSATPRRLRMASCPSRTGARPRRRR